MSKTLIARDNCKSKIAMIRRLELTFITDLTRDYILRAVINFILTTIKIRYHLSA